MFRRQKYCERCNILLGDSYVSLCAECFRVPAESLRPMDIPFADTAHNLCAICASESPARELKSVCESCASKHPDTTHSNFGRNREAIFSHCERCGSLQVPTWNAQQAGGYTYFRTGENTPVSEPFPCPGASWAKTGCEHDWILVQSIPPETQEPLEHDAARLFLNDEQMQALRDSIRAGTSTYWCCTCGSVRHAHTDSTGSSARSVS